MTVAGKINALVLSTAIAAGVLLTAIALIGEYESLRSRLFEQSVHLVNSQAQLPAAIYFGDLRAQSDALDALLQSSSAIRNSALRLTDGRILGQRQAQFSPDIPLAPLDSLRINVPVAETGIATHRQPFPGGPGVLLNPLGGDIVWDMTIPVLSGVNPAQPGLSPQVFGHALANPKPAQGVHVVAYVQLGISASSILGLSLSHIAPVAGIAILFILLSSVFSWYLTHRITAPFSIIKQMADDIATGNAVKYEGIEKSGEFREIVALLNSMIGGLHSYKTRMDVDHQLLSMKVEERTSQLSRRNEELNQAVQEVTEAKNRLRKMAYYDSLTSLPNRRLFTEQLDLLLRLARRNSHFIALLFVDLDNFKRINDSLGHSAGDLLLREAARRLSECVRESDLVGHNVEPNSRIDVSRLGGDEFTVVLNQLDDPASASLVAQRLLDALIEPMTIDNHELVITPSIGIAIAPRDGTTVETLLKAADKAMYHCKTSGKNRFMYFEEGMDAAGLERLALENDLRRALESDGLSLHYQPQVDSITGEVVGAEALMRWEHPEQGFIPPYKFIALAEEMGLIGPMGEWALQTACHQLMELRNEGLDLPQVSVNISALQFNDAFFKQVSEVLAETGMHPKRLKLELTESIMVDNTTNTLDALSYLKELGVGLSIDDFGTGYSSLNYLSRLPLDELKIDRSFVIDIDKSRSNASLVIAIIAMARSMGLRLVAEGVETEEQYRFLRNHGASIIQGYLFSKPVPLDELKPLLAPGAFRPYLNRNEIAAG